MSLSPLLFIILIPIIGALFSATGVMPRRWATIASGLNLILVLVLWAVYPAGQGEWAFTSKLPVMPALDINFSLGADRLSLIMLLLSTIVTFAAVLVSPARMEKGEGMFYACILFISAGAIGAFASTDVFFFYMFHELALIPTFLLIGIWGSGDRQAAAWRITVYLALGSFILLIGLLGLYFITPEPVRTFDMRKLQEMGGIIPPVGWVYATLLVGFGILISLFPFHSWAPQAYASAPAPAAMMHAGVLKKFGLYGMLRLTVPIFGDSVEWVTHLLLILLVGNILYIGLVTIAQRKLDWMLGYSSVMHMGYIFLGIAGLNVLSLSGASILMLAHGLSIAALFALAGEIRSRTGTLEFSHLGGLAKQFPGMAFLFGLAAMASIGLPGFANFAGEVLVFFGAFAAGSSAEATRLAGFNFYQIVTVCSLWGVVISAVYMLRSYRNVFFGDALGKAPTGSDLSFVTRSAVTLLILALLLVGFFPGLVTGGLVQSLIP